MVKTVTFMLCILYHKIKANLQEVTIIPNPALRQTRKNSKRDLYCSDPANGFFNLQFQQAF